MDTSWGKKGIEISFVKGDNLSTLRRQLVVTAGHAEVYIIDDFGNVEVKSVESIVSKLGSPKKISLVAEVSHSSDGVSFDKNESGGPDLPMKKWEKQRARLGVEEYRKRCRERTRKYREKKRLALLRGSVSQPWRSLQLEASEVKKVESTVIVG